MVIEILHGGPSTTSTGNRCEQDFCYRKEICKNCQMMMIINVSNKIIPEQRVIHLSVHDHGLKHGAFSTHKLHHTMDNVKNSSGK